VGHPATIYGAWLNRRFALVSSTGQLEELRAVLRKPDLAKRIRPANAGRLVNQLSKLAELAGPLPRVRRSSDPDDDLLLAIAEAGQADYLVSGDKSGLLALGSHRRTRILSAREFTKLLA
jgi:putative PIN family toxin of toxin-antitoxin system